MRHKLLKIENLSLLCILAVALVATNRVSADDEVPVALLATFERQALDYTPGGTVNNTQLDLSVSWPEETKLERTSAIRLPEPRSQVISFAKKCADLKAIPLIEITAQEDRHVFFGIQFDGYLGIYARL